MIQFIPIVISVFGGCLLLIALKKLFSAFTDGESIAILGPQAAGKTLLLKTLQGKPYDEYEATPGSVSYDKFVAKHGGKKIIIKKGKDIAGVRNNCKIYYEDLVKDSDRIIFIFDISKALTSEDYREDVWERADFIWTQMEKHQKTEYLVIASHSDKVLGMDCGEMQERLLRSLRDEPAKEMFEKRMLITDMTQKKQFLNKLFDMLKG